MQGACRICGNGLSEIGEKAGYKLAECNSCGFIFCPGIDATYLKNLYQSGWHGVDDGAPEHGWCKRSFLNPALRRFDANESLSMFEFGVGQSSIPEELRQEGHQVAAIDIAPPLRPHPDRITGDILEVSLRENQFDLVYSLQVFEHLPDPAPIFAKLLEIAKPDRYVFIHTDMKPKEPGFSFLDWPYVAPPDHCSYYNIEVFKRMIGDQPHEVVEWSRDYALIRKK